MCRYAFDHDADIGPRRAKVSSTLTDSVRKTCHAIRHTLISADLYDQDGHVAPFRIGIAPFPLTSEIYHWLERLGPALLSFYKALNQMYHDSATGHIPVWFSQYLDQGKPDTLIEYGRSNRFRFDLPGVMRPDLILTDDDRFIATELDAVPGGIGLTALLSVLYMQSGDSVLGGATGMCDGFARMIRSYAAGSDAVTLAVVVSEESRDYRPEMRWLTHALWHTGLRATSLSPEEVSCREGGLWASIRHPGQPAEKVAQPEETQIDVLYRFFELFDLANVPQSARMLDAAKKRRVSLTPPAKTYLEEKSAFALFHHPALAPLWRRHLGEETDLFLRQIFPETWVLDPSPMPPQGIIPGLTLRGTAVSNFRSLGEATQKERHFVIKPSGFSELAWGSRGVVMGHDLSGELWRKALDRALSSFSTTPHVLQPFYKGKKVQTAYYDFNREAVVEMEGRVRLSPYYFVAEGEARLGGILATICPLDKKNIHGMAEAVMVPCGTPLADNHAHHY